MSVSERTEELVTQLVAWELFGIEEVNPKNLLRQVSLADLTELRTNLGAHEQSEESISALLVEVEVLYRHGHLVGDWEAIREGEKLTLKYSMNARYTCHSIPLLLTA
jgi:hypothetical protein